MKLLLLSVLYLSLVGCTTTTTRNADGSTVTVRTVDHKAIRALEPAFDHFGAAAIQGALNFLQDQNEQR